MRELRTFSRERREHELGELLLALAARWAVSFEDMVIATERPAAEIEQIIETFRQHDEMCRTNAAADRVRRHSLSFTVARSGGAAQVLAPSRFRGSATIQANQERLCAAGSKGRP